MKSFLIKNYKILIISIFLSIGAVGAAYFLLNQSTDQLEISHIPVKLKKEGNSSLLNIQTGEIEFEGEFKNYVGIVSEGIFITTNSDNEVFYNKITEKNKFEEIAGPFKQGTSFHSGIALVTPVDGYIRAIDRTGEEIFELTPSDGVEFTSVGQLFDGRIQFQNQNGFYGFIDKKGKVVIEPKYDFVEDFKEGVARVGYHDDNKKLHMEIIDRDGEIIREIDNSAVGRVTDHKIAYCEERGEWGILDYKSGDKILKPKEKYNELMIFEKAILFKNDGQWGVLNTEGEVLIRPKYKILNKLSDELFIGMKNDGENTEYEILNSNGDVLKKSDMSESALYTLNENRFIYKDGKEYVLANELGEILSKESIKDIEGGHDELYLMVNSISKKVASDYFNWDEIKKVISGIKAGEFNGLKMGQNCIQFESTLNKFTESKESEKNNDHGMGEYILGYSDWIVNGNYFCKNLGKGFSENDDSSVEEVYADDESYEYGTENPYADSSYPKESIYDEEPIDDKAPNWGLYQYTLYGVKQTNTYSISVYGEFDDYIKKSKIKTVRVEEEYYSYDTEKTIGYYKNPESLIKIMSFTFELTKNSEKRNKQLNELIKEELKSKFNAVSKNKYTDNKGFIWVIKNNKIEISKM